MTPPARHSLHPTAPYPIGTPGHPWGLAERRAWRDRQSRQRSHPDEVQQPLNRLSGAWRLLTYGQLVYSPDRYDLQALCSPNWWPGLPGVLVTGGVHGYETSGVLGALAFARDHGAEWADRVNLLVVPCVSPWAYERIQRWNADAVDPNRSFCPPAPGQPWAAEESAALWRLVEAIQGPGWPVPGGMQQGRLQGRLQGRFVAHIDLHETTDTDETEFRPALAARDGRAFVPGSIPDGFYLVDDAANPQPEFQAAVLAAVSAVTHVAEADEQGQLIGSPVVAPGVIHYPVREWGLCTAVTGARWTTITEVYPDSPRTHPAECVAAQVAAVQAALAYVVDHLAPA